MIRSALLVAVAYTATIAVWTIGRLALGEVAQSTGLIAASALLITQCIIAMLITPWLAGDEKGQGVTGVVPLLTTPWPLLLLVIGISGISTTTMVLSQIWVGGLAILSYLSARGLIRILRDGQLRNIVQTVLQFAPATALWAGRKTWIPWFTG